MAVNPLLQDPSAAPLRCLLVDDEQDARDMLSKMIRDFCPELEITGTADSVASGKEAILELRPEVVFLDIRMSDGVGFDLLEQIGPVDFAVVFVTAYDQYAIRAFEFSALDYLLKPVSPTQLIKVVHKAVKARNEGKWQERVAHLLSSLREDDMESRKIVLPSIGNFQVVKVADILYCAAERNYTWVYFTDGNKLLVSKNLKEFEVLLSHTRFFRIHQSYLINLRHVKGFQKGRTGEVELIDGTKLRLAQSKKNSFVSLFDDGELNFQP